MEVVSTGDHHLMNALRSWSSMTCLDCGKPTDVVHVDGDKSHTPHVAKRDQTTTHRCPECGDVHLPPGDPEVEE